METPRSSSTLLVRHLPADLDDQDKIDLLTHFGAKSARPMGTIGPMKHTAFARFDTPEAAEQCLKRLHQMEVFGRKLVVEFAKSEHEKNFPVGTDEKLAKETKTGIDKIKTETVAVSKPNEKSDPTFVKHNIPYPRKPNLYYLYPPPTVSTLTNIANALASQPKFYTQVLHLMNKMNLPCPFGVVTASPPLALDNPNITGRAKYSVRADEVVSGEIQEVEMDQDSTEESEMDSDNDNRQIDGGKGKTNTGESGQVRKSLKRPRKKMKLVQPDMSMIIRPTVIPKTSEVFENVEGVRTKQISLNFLGKEIGGSAGCQNIPVCDTRERIEVGSSTGYREKQIGELTVVEGGFGKVEPQNKPHAVEDVQKVDLNYKIDPSKFMTKDTVTSGKLRASQLKDFSVFKKYTPGECTSRLYVKNLTKQTTEQELVNLFGPFINWSIDLAYDTFDIRLMKEGRMKGQAFITLPDEGSAQNIVTECNGYILNNKPVVIQFARSAKAKEVDKAVSNE